MQIVYLPLISHCQSITFSNCTPGHPLQNYYIFHHAKALQQGSSPLALPIRFDVLGDKQNRVHLQLVDHMIWRSPFVTL